MRVYQFRHIRAERQSSRSAFRLPRTRQRHVTRFSYVSPSMTVVRRGLAIFLLCLLALATGAARAEQNRTDGELVEVVVGLSQRPLGDDPLGSRPAAAVAHPDVLATRARRADRDEPPAAQVRWRYQLVANGMAVVLPRSQVERLRSLPGVAQIYPSVRYRPLLDRSPQQIGAPALWAPGLDECRRGNQDRDHRRRNRPDPSVLHPGRVSDAAGLPEGPGRLHDGEGDRRARVPAAAPGLEERFEAVRPRALLPRHARRGDRGRQRRHRRVGSCASPASRRARISATTRR